MRARFVFENFNESAIPSYEFQKVEHELGNVYKFATEDGDKYLVRFFDMFEIHKQKKYEDFYQVEFVTNDEKGDTVVVNKGRFYKVMTTIIEIIEEFVKEKDPRVLKISPSANYKGDTRRRDIYIRYIKKLLPDNYKYTKSLFGNVLYIKKKKTKNES